jgi:hypothetical protein
MENRIIDPSAPPPAEPAEVAPRAIVADGELKITVKAGMVNVDGPIQDRAWCYGVLMLAHDSIQEWWLQQMAMRHMQAAQEQRESQALLNRMNGKVRKG